MATQQAHAQMGGATAGAEEIISAGAVNFGLEYRNNVGEKKDEGICIHVYGNEIAGDDKELLRLDCFKYDPHYHYRNAPIKKNIRLMLDYTAEGDPLTWALDRIKNRLPAMLRYSRPEPSTSAGSTATTSAKRKTRESVSTFTAMRLPAMTRNCCAWTASSMTRTTTIATPPSRRIFA